ncbi:branched-chain amino acid aminotransferase [Sneathiella sp. CAU 1612]|uniref:Probable branched-chain-amino-acid aminotransferase n=1 Tax=Sneathiella sedimenti TaxID=2816034 RepID=A0ABS3F0S9_9PROT|nr:branched-chain amino acid aminotransferase [Sneathiella sedimenti]MBO0332050.1 branched-chain amino acid aminotransferase [Sneathiella sedimenti]
MAGVFFYNGDWYDESPRVTGPMDHAFWMSSTVFDGARSFQGMAPDLDKHCARLARSARALGFEPTMETGEVLDLCTQAVRKLPKESELYIRPMYFARGGFIDPEPDSAEFILAVYDSPMPDASGFSAHFAKERRPARDMAPTDAKASCLYPNSGRAVAAARKAGFDNAILMDANDNVAEFATANIWIAKDGVLFTPAATGCFLAGITRERVKILAEAAGIEVQETFMSREDVMNADEIFNSGNFGKIMPVTRIENRELQPGPVAAKLRKMYMEFARDSQLF